MLGFAGVTAIDWSTAARDGQQSVEPLIAAERGGDASRCRRHGGRQPAGA